MQVSALDPLANRLVVLAPDLLAKVLMSRAVFSRALALRRCIERERLTGSSSGWGRRCLSMCAIAQSPA